MSNKEMGLQGKNGLIPLQGIVINATLHDHLSEVVIEQHYKNNESTNIEAVYTFPLPHNAVLMELTMKLGERMLHGKISANKEAEAAYEEAIVEGDNALLLQKKRMDFTP